MAVSRTSLLLFLFLSACSLRAQEIVFQTSFDDDTGLVSLPGSDDTAITFGYDYSDFDAIPEAPNSALLSGDPITGLKLEANIEVGEAAAVAIVTEGLELSGSYEVQVDAWLNYIPPAGGIGTTEFGGIGVGHDGEFGGLNGASFLYDSDGDSGSDYRLFKDLSLIAVESGQYAIESLNNTDEAIVMAFPGVDLAEALTNPFLAGTTPDGSGGFRWMTVKAVVDTNAVGAGTTTDPGIATFSLTDATTGNSLEIGTIDNSAGDGVVNMSGNASVLFADLFESIAPSEGELSFGIFDNLIITQLESTMADPLDCDMSGAVDTGDISCATADTISDTLAAANIIPGDLNLDGSVGFPDFLILSTNFTNAEVAGVYSNGDINLDGEISFPDFLVLSGNFNMMSPAAAAVPEPQSFGLLLIGVVGLFCFRSR